MKSVFVVRLSEDGLMTSCYTNIKAVHDALQELEESGVYLKKAIQNYPEPDRLYSYSNLVKSIRTSQSHRHFTVAYIQCHNESQIEITEHIIKTK